MVRSKDKYTVSVDFPIEWKERIAALAKHEGTTINGVVNRAVMESMLAYEGDQTTRVRVRQIQADVTELKEMVKLSNAVAFTGLNAIELLHTVSDKDKAWVERQIDKVKG
jgi:predicted DNA-binding protein